jgi:hypothetical protein
MKMKDRIVSFLSVTERSSGKPYLHDDMQLLEMLAQQIIENYYHLRLFDEFREKQKLDSELSIASQIQQDIIPKSFQTRGQIEVAALNLPAKIVGGDFYDYIPLSKNRYGAIIADVSGRGYPPACSWRFPTASCVCCFNRRGTRPRFSRLPTGSSAPNRNRACSLRASAAWSIRLTRP